MLAAVLLAWLGFLAAVLPIAHDCACWLGWTAGPTPARLVNPARRSRFQSRGGEFRGVLHGQDLGHPAPVEGQRHHRKLGDAPAAVRIGPVIESEDRLGG